MNKRKNETFREMRRTKKARKSERGEVGKRKKGL
jgi:hypothetical protein